VDEVLEFLKPDGVIIMHDCNPLSEVAALPAASYEHAANIMGFSGEWNGDVWKTIVNLRSTRKDLDIFVLDCDQGLGIIASREPQAGLSFTPEEEEASDLAIVLRAGALPAPIIQNVTEGLLERDAGCPAGGVP
jgi:hypothetical protein